MQEETGEKNKICTSPNLKYFFSPVSSRTHPTWSMSFRIFRSDNSRPVSKRHAIACAHLFTHLTNAKHTIHRMPKIFNLSLLVILSSDFLLFENRSSFFFSFRICRKTCSCGSLWKFLVVHGATKNCFLVVPQKLRSS